MPIRRRRRRLEAAVSPVERIACWRTDTWHLAELTASRRLTPPLSLLRTGRCCRHSQNASSIGCVPPPLPTDDSRTRERTADYDDDCIAKLPFAEQRLEIADSSSPRIGNSCKTFIVFASSVDENRRRRVVSIENLARIQANPWPLSIHHSRRHQNNPVTQRRRRRRPALSTPTGAQKSSGGTSRATSRPAGDGPVARKKSVMVLRESEPMGTGRHSDSRRAAG